MRIIRQAINLGAFSAGKIRPLSGPVKVTWEVTYRCNSRCKHCHLWQEKNHDELSTEEAKRFISDLKDLGVLHLSFSGGEPFLRKDMFEIASFARDMGLATGVNTNGSMLVDKRNARKACESGLGTVFISLDGATPERHNDLRGTPKAFDSAICAIDNLIDQRGNSSTKVFINTTVTRDNVEHLGSILELARAHGVDGMTMSVIQDIGKYSPENHTSIEADMSEGLTERLVSLAKGSGGMIPHSREYLSNFETYLRHPNNLYKYRCVAGYATALVHPNGEVHPCPVAFESMGSLREKSFRKIWYSAQADSVRKKIKENKHPICWFDCVAPLSVLLHNIRKFEVAKVLHKKTLMHILNKTRGGGIMARVLVTGATGFAGSNLANKLIEDGQDVNLLIRPHHNTSKFEQAGARVILGDITDKESVEKAVAGVDIVYHVAALFRKAGLPDSDYWATNHEGTLNLLSASLKAGVKKFMHCSTVGVLGNIANPPADETWPYKPGDIYQVTKCEGEKAALSFHKEKGLPVTVVRPAGIYGPGDKRWLKLFRTIAKRRFMMIGDGETFIHMVYVSDLVNAFQLAAENPNSAGKVYIAGGERYVTLNELAKTIADIVGAPIPRLHIPVKPVHILSGICEDTCRAFRVEPPIYRRRVDFFVKDRAFNITKAKTELGYVPEISLEDGIMRTADWYKGQRLL